MQIFRNLRIEGKHGRPIMLDVFYAITHEAKPVIVYCHGFKGFKDWGTFNLIAEYFANQGFIFVKFNFSYNGTTPDESEDCPDPEAFAENNFSKELDDLVQVIDWLTQNNCFIPVDEFDKELLYLIGHSRGGGVAILKAAEDKRIKKITSWAAINDIAMNWFAERLDAWKEKGYQEIENKRTGQVLRLNYQIVEDYFKNKERLDIHKAVKTLDIPFLVVHGTEDESVPMEKALEMKRWNPDIQLELIPGASHTFGGKHPYKEKTLPVDTQIVLERTLEFFEDSIDKEEN